MLGLGTGKGGNSIAQAFLQNKATAPTGPAAPIGNITQPVRPTIAPPTLPPQRKPQAGPAAPAITPWTMFNSGGQMKPAWMTSMVQKTGMPTDGRTVEAANWRQKSTPRFR